MIVSLAVCHNVLYSNIKAQYSHSLYTHHFVVTLQEKSTDAPTDSLEEQAATTEAPSGQPAPKPVTESPTVSPTGPKKKCRRRLKQGHKGPGDKKPGDEGPKGDKPGENDKDVVGAADDDECI